LSERGAKAAKGKGLSAEGEGLSAEGEERVSDFPYIISHLPFAIFHFRKLKRRVRITPALSQILGKS